MPSEEVMHEFKHGRLHSGTGKKGKKGKKVKSRAQAVAIMLDERRREGKPTPRKKGGKRYGKKS